MGSQIELLLNDGWNLKEKAIQKFQDDLSGNKKPSIIALALNSDLFDIGEKYVQEAIKDNVLLGPCVLQIGKIRNISAPKENEHSNVAPRMLRVSLTDGHSTITAIEHEHIEQISLKTAPGTKVKLFGSIAISSGLLQLHPGCVKLLGGKVEKLYAKWKITIDTAGLIRIGNTSDGAPPPLVAFGKHVDVNYNIVKEGTKSLIAKESENGEGDAEFEEQRKAAIAEVTKVTAASKTFSSAGKTNNFGKKPNADIASNNRSTASTGSEHSFDARKINSHVASQKESGIYRDLSTESGENVHQKTVKEFVEMGFKRSDVVLCLRKSNNDFEFAMDLLVAMPNEITSTFEDRGGYRGRRSDGRRGGGRGRGRGRNRYDTEDDISQPTNSSTLFDFLESKISTTTRPTSDKKNDRMSTSYEKESYNAHRSKNNDQYEYHQRGRGRGQRGNQRNTGFSSDRPTMHKYHGEHNREDSRERRERERKTGNSSDRPSSQKYLNENKREDIREQRERERKTGYSFDRPTSQKYHSDNYRENSRERREREKRTGYAADKPSSQKYHLGGNSQERGVQGSNKNYSAYGDTNKFKNSFERNESNRGQNRRGERGSSNITRETHGNQHSNNEIGKRYSSNRISGDTRNNSDLKDFHNIPEFGISASEYRKENQKYQQQNEKEKIPPRLQKNNSRTDRHQPNNKPGETGWGNANILPANDTKSANFGADVSSLPAKNIKNVPFSNVALNPPPVQRAPTTFGSSTNLGSSIANLKKTPPSDTQVHVSSTNLGSSKSNFEKTPPSDTQVHVSSTNLGSSKSSFKKTLPSDTQVHVSSTNLGSSKLSFKKTTPSDTQVHVTLPNWQVDSQCMAKYWEDGCFYQALVTDIHATAMTAVVQFTAFGNYEEVPFFDLKPLRPNMMMAPQPTNYGNYVDQQGNQRAIQNSYSNQRSYQNHGTMSKPPIALYVPPPNRNNPG